MDKNWQDNNIIIGKNVFEQEISIAVTTKVLGEGWGLDYLPNILKDNDFLLILTNNEEILLL